MAVQTVTTNSTIYEWMTAYNLLAGYAGDVSGLSSGITDNIGDNTVTNALNYLYTLATTGVSTFADAITFQNTILVQGAASFENNLTVNGSFTFDNTGSAAVTTIHDEDNMVSDDATGLATQQSIKAYVDALSGTVNAGTLQTFTAAQFLRSDADDTVDNDIHLQFGDGTSGSVRLEHNSTGNYFAITPFDGSSFNASHNFTFDGDEDYWKFAGEMRVLGAFTSLGIDDNGTSNKLQIENSAITLKTATTIQGALTISSGNLILPEAETTAITNGAGEFITLDGSNNDVDINAAATLAAKFTGTGASTLYYNGSAKLATSNTGVSVTGALTTSGNLITGANLVGPTGMVLDNGAGETITFAGTTISFGVNTTTRLQATTSGISVTGAITSTGDGTFNTSDERLKNILGNINNPLDIINKLDGVYFQWNEKTRERDPTSNLIKMNSGVIAQNIEKHFPQALGEEIDGYKTVGYSALIPLLIEAVKELDRKIECLSTQE